MVVAVLQHDFELDPTEERGGWVEDEPVVAGIEAGREVRDPAVLVRRASTDPLVGTEELDPDSARRLAAAGVEDMGGE